MPRHKSPMPLRWRGPETIDEASRSLGERRPVVVSLPLSFHHVLCARLCGYARLFGALSIDGDEDLLGRVAEIEGLHELEQLREPARLTGASVRLTSAPPKLHLFFANGLASAGRGRTPLEAQEIGTHEAHAR